MTEITRALAALLLIVAAGLAQSPDAKNCSIDGSVVNSVTGAPVPRAQVGVVGSDDTYVADSNSAGNWSVERLSCGRVTITVNRIGFLRVQQSNLLLAANTPMHGVDLKLAPQSVLAGRVLDDEGDPILGAQVSLMTSRIINGLRGIQASTSTTTNDLGEYRFSGLTAGKYILCANAGGGVVANGSRSYGERCYPGPMDGGAASAMDVATGYEGRIDFALAPLVTVHVSGVVSGGTEGVTTSINLRPHGQIARMYMGLSTQARPDGTFSIRNVPPGSYTVEVASNPNNRRLTARVPIDVGESGVEGLQLHLEPGVTVTGTVKIVAATGKKIENPRYAILLRSSEGVFSYDPTDWDETRTAFTITDVVPGNYRLDVSPATVFYLKSPAPFYLKSATLGGRDIAGSDVAIGPGGATIEVVMSDDGGVVEGDVSGDDGPAAAWVLLEKDGAPSRNARTDANGHFNIDTVPPGDYRVYAWDDNTKVEYANPEWVRRNGKGVAVTVDPGQTAQVKVVRQIAPAE